MQKMLGFTPNNYACGGDCGDRYGYCWGGLSHGISGNDGAGQCQDDPAAC